MSKKAKKKDSTGKGGNKSSSKKRDASPPHDPNHSTERQKYEFPVASRDYIRSVLHDAGSPMDFDQLVERFGLNDTPEQQEGLRRRLAAMLRDAQLIRNRKGGFVPVDEADLIVGRVSAHPDGFGFLIADAGGDDVYLNGKQMRRALHGDRAVVCITGEDRRGRREGRIVDVTERANHQIVGRLLEERGIYIVAPDNRRIHQDLMIPENALGGARGGDMVIADIVEQPTNRHPPVGKITTVLGQHLRPGMETDVALASHEIPHHWPEDVEDALTRIVGEVTAKDCEGRKDVRNLPLVTIDGEDARDFDDAVYCEARDDGWRLFVAIADVSHYVRHDEPLDGEAYRRGTSVYFPNRVVPMLPEVLSNGLCSLNPDVDRLCMLCEMTLDKSGAIKRTRFHRAVMHSHARLTYTQVAAMLVDKDKQLRQQFKPVLPHLQQLHKLFKALSRARKKRGAIEFESNETRIVFNQQQKIDEIVPVQRNDAHKMIEECMILANVAAARYLHRHRLPALYRVHAHPTADKLEELRAFLSLHGLSLGGGDTPAATDYAKLSRQVMKRPDAAVISTVMLRSMQQAVYQPRNDGHFGLALEEYAHFTSPIRRYPDLLVHRAIAFSLEGGKAKDYRYDHEAMVGLGEHCSMTERRADEATRDVTSWLKCEYMQDHVGDEFAGVVSAVTSFGLFVQLSDIHVEGLIHITSMGSDYFRFNQTAHTLVGEHTGVRYGLGDEIHVVVAAVNLEERKIDFQPVTTTEKRKSGRKKTTPKHVKRKARQAAADSGQDSGKRKKTTKRKANGKTAASRKPRSKTKTRAKSKAKAKTKTKKTGSKKHSARIGRRKSSAKKAAEKTQRKQGSRRD
ncbi:MAG: ribonuclease R [Gammaproteobacteria bacterium]|nr:ribonuclease R [Gammaproteobacteria bacterium]